MALVKHVREKIWEIEGFRVRFIDRETGRTAHADTHVAPYGERKASKNSWSVAEWKKKKFSHKYPDYEVEVLCKYQERAPGRMVLGTVRDTYLEE